MKTLPCYTILGPLPGSPGMTIEGYRAPHTGMNSVLARQKIIDVVCDVFSLADWEIFSDRREPWFVMARHAAAYLFRELTAMSYPEIGRALKRDHTTIIYAVKRAEERAQQDPDFAAKLSQCFDKLRGDE